MTEEEVKKEAEEYLKTDGTKAEQIFNMLNEISPLKITSTQATFIIAMIKQVYQDGAEFGYNKANEWHYVKDELPIGTDSTLCELMPVFVAVKVGYNISTYGTYWNLKLGKFECLDKVYAWCYTPEPPELKESE